MLGESAHDQQARHADAEAAADQLEQQEALGGVEFVDERRSGPRAHRPVAVRAAAAAAARSSRRASRRHAGLAGAAAARSFPRDRRLPGSSPRKATPGAPMRPARTRAARPSSPRPVACRRPGSRRPRRHRAVAPRESSGPARPPSRGSKSARRVQRTARRSGASNGQRPKVAATNGHAQRAISALRIRQCRASPPRASPSPRPRRRRRTRSGTPPPRGPARAASAPSPAPVRA